MCSTCIRRKSWWRWWVVDNLDIKRDCVGLPGCRQKQYIHRYWNPQFNKDGDLHTIDIIYPMHNTVNIPSNVNLNTPYQSNLFYRSDNLYMYVLLLQKSQPFRHSVNQGDYWRLSRGRIVDSMYKHVTISNNL